MKWIQKFLPWRHVWEVRFFWLEKEERQFSYYHFWYDIQRHCLKLGIIDIEWCGWPWHKDDCSC